MNATLLSVITFIAVGVVDASGQTLASDARATFPEGAKIAFVDLQRVASSSATGKAATAQIEALRGKKTAELTERQKQLRDLETKLSGGASVLNAEALAKLGKDVERRRRDLERFSQDAQEEIQQMQIQLQRSFGEKLFPVIGQVAESKSIWAVFNLEPTNVLWHNKSLDISDEVVARLDVVAAPQVPAPQPPR